MSIPSAAPDTVIADERVLVEHLASGEKPRADWRIGTEHEKFGFCASLPPGDGLGVRVEGAWLAATPEQPDPSSGAARHLLPGGR